MAQTEKQVLQMVDEWRTTSRDYMEKLFENFEDYEKLYFGHLDSTNNKYKSQAVDPEVFEKVERTTSHLMATRPRGRFLPREMTDVPSTRIADEVFRYQWDKSGQNMHKKLTRTVKSMAMFGTAYGLLRWRYQKSGDKIIWDDPYYKDLYIYDCYPDVSADSIEDMEYFGHDEYVTLQDLKREKKRYKNLGKLEDKVKAEKDKQTASTDSYRNNVDDIRGTERDTIKGRIRITRWYTRERWISEARDYDLVIEDRDCPYDHKDLPIHELSDHVYPNQPIGIGEVEPIARLQRALNNVLNQRLDNVDLILKPVMKTRANTRYAHTWKFLAGQKWLVDNMDDVQTFSIPDTTASTFQQTTNYFKDAMAKSLGHFDILSRNETNVDRTATEVNLAGREQNARLNTKETNVDTFIKRLATQWMQLNQQFMTEPRLIRIVGKEALDVMANEIPLEQIPVMNGMGEQVGVEEQEPTVMYDGREVEKFQLSDDGSYGYLFVEPQDIAGEFDFIVESGSTVMENPQFEVQNLSQALKILMDEATVAQLAEEGKRINISPIIEKLVMKLGIKNVDEIFQVIDESEMQMGMVDPMMGQPPMQPPMQPMNNNY